VLASRGSSPEARAALADLCAAYWEPVFQFLRGQGRDDDAARELTQEFFARLLAGAGVTGADPARGRFRSYLLGALKHFLQAERTRRLAAKRGHGAETVPLDAPADDTHAGLSLPDPSALPPDVLFDRHWAATLLAHALDRLGRELAAEGRGRHFAVLKPALLGGGDAGPQAALAAELELSENAVKVAIHRLRRRFRDTVRAEIAETLHDPAQVDEEMRSLLAALG